jgi:hypothetical protein
VAGHWDVFVTSDSALRRGGPIEDGELTGTSGQPGRVVGRFTLDRRRGSWWVQVRTRFGGTGTLQLDSLTLSKER